MMNLWNWIVTLVRWEIEGGRTFGEYLMGVVTIFFFVLLWKDIAAKIKEKKAQKVEQSTADGEEVAAEVIE